MCAPIVLFQNTEPRVGCEVEIPKTYPMEKRNVLRVNLFPNSVLEISVIPVPLPAWDSPASLCLLRVLGNENLATHLSHSAPFI